MIVGECMVTHWYMANVTTVGAWRRWLDIHHMLEGIYQYAVFQGDQEAAQDAQLLIHIALRRANDSEPPPVSLSLDGPRRLHR